MQDGKLEVVHLELLAEQQRLEERLCSASAMCMHCHSGGLMKPVLCQNGECSVSLTAPLLCTTCQADRLRDYHPNKRMRTASTTCVYYYQCARMCSHARRISADAGSVAL